MPLLNVTRAKLPIDSKHSLSDAGRWTRCNRRDTRTFGELERGGQIVERRLSHVLQERKCRRRERRGNTRLLDPHDAIPGAKYQVSRYLARNAKPRPEVVLVQPPRCSRTAITPEVIHALCVQVKHG